MSPTIRLAVVSILSFYLYNPLSVHSGYVNYIEFLTSTTPNEPYINTLYFWWVNLPYISFLFMGLFLIVIFIVVRSIPGLAIIALSAYSLWFTELADFISSNAQISVITTLDPLVNSLLLNALNKYHPLLFYLSVASLLALLLQSIFGMRDSVPFKSLGSVRKGGSLVKWPFALNSTALIFGSWWALQEGTWGGWWNWDSSETFGLFPALIILAMNHGSRNPVHFWRRSWMAGLGISTFLLFYSVLQLNFDLISHNFGARFFHFFNSNLLYVLVIPSLFSIAVLNWLRLSSVTNCGGLASRATDVLFSRSFSSPYSRILTYSLLWLWVFYSFFDFIEILDIPLLHVLIFNGRLSFYDINTFLLLPVYACFCSLLGLRYLSTRLPPSLFSPLAPHFICFGFGLGSFWKFLLHNLLTIFILLCLLTNFTSLKFWSVVFDGLATGAALDFAPNWRLINTCDSWGVEVSKSLTPFNGRTLGAWSRWDLSNYPRTDLLSLGSNQSTIQSLLIIEGSYTVSSILVEIPLLSPLFTLAISVVAIYFFKIR